jgi:hypothetical protein
LGVTNVVDMIGGNKENQIFTSAVASITLKILLKIRFDWNRWWWELNRSRAVYLARQLGLRPMTVDMISVLTSEKFYVLLVSRIDESFQCLLTLFFLTSPAPFSAPV